MSAVGGDPGNIAHQWHFDDDVFSLIKEVRHQLHKTPELSHKEFRTQALLQQVLKEAGIETVRAVFNTGLVVDIEGIGSEPARRIGFRGELDALPITETRDDVAFQSEVSGVMHACGHDTHAAIALGIALQLHRERDKFGGLARIWFQPAEEAEPLGGRAFRDLGYMDGIEAAIGVHVNPGLPSGTIGALPGVVNCSSDEWHATILGRSGHGGKPHEGIDAINIAASFIQELNHIVARCRDPNEPLVITVGQIHGGSATNIVCGRVELAGTIRAMNEALRKHVHRLLNQLAAHLGPIYGATIELRITEGEPMTRNDPSLVDVVLTTAKDLLGPDGVSACKPWTASDDFGFYSEVMPSVYYWYGCNDPARGNIHGLHHPQFAVSDEDMVVAARVGLQVMGRLLTLPPITNTI